MILHKPYLNHTVLSNIFVPSHKFLMYDIFTSTMQSSVLVDLLTKKVSLSNAFFLIIEDRK